MNEANDLMMVGAVERYIMGEMTPDERVHFENLRKSNPAVDMLVVEHTIFLQQLNQYGQRKKFRDTLHEVHEDLNNKGTIQGDKLAGTTKVRYLFNKYKRVTAIAASIAGITAIGLSVIVNSVAPHPKDPKVQELVHQMNVLNQNQRALNQKIDHVDKKSQSQQNFANIPVRFNGTGFLLDNKGMMITNAHVVKNSVNIYVQNNKGEQYKAIVLKLDVNRDVAIVKIDDEHFKPLASLPYSISRTSAEIAEPIFTLGFPRDEIVYGEGYLSAKTGFSGDTLSCQISVDANPGNSGGPVFNRNGEVIGILSTKEIATEGAVFAVQSKYIYHAMADLQKNSIYRNVKISSKSSLAGMDKVQQVKKIQDCIFMVKGD